jgi:hypothetical protein
MFGLTLLEVQIHDQMDLYSHACGEAAHHGGNMWYSKNLLPQGQEYKTGREKRTKVL